jgi:peptidoglycan/xylan/chitin deacetylase (PgdA/CDA1 family)
MKNVLAALTAACFLTALPACAEAPKGFDVAITVDDLPAHGAVPPGVSRTDVARDYLAALKAHKVPGVYGFINAIHIKEDQSNIEVLKMWRAAGYPLGNHGYSHMNINTGGLEAFKGDLIGNEAILADQMGAEDWHVLRFPFLNAGTDPALHSGIMTWLKAHNYRIADVTMSFNDWAYTDTYARCMAKGDTAAVEAMKAQYMQGVKASIARGLSGSEKVYGRQIPHVLLVHEGAFTALMLPQVLETFEKAGARFVTLDQAQRDPAYSAPSDHQGEQLLIDRAAKEKGIDIWKDAPADVDISNLAGLCT